MAAAVWAISYAVDKRREEYLEWFHGVHIPEKLARPGYAWAAHYEADDAPGRYLALFGAADARAFLDPTPGQLKPRQDARTREMTGLRIQPAGSVFIEALARGAGQPGAWIRFFAGEPDDADGFCAWAVQEHLPGLAHAALLAAAIGRPRLAVMEHHDSREAIAPCARLPGAFIGRRLAP